MALIKSGLIKIQIGKNGNGTESIRASLDKMETNDLVHLDGKLDKVIDKLDKLIEISQKVLYIIEDTKR